MNGLYAFGSDDMHRDVESSHVIDHPRTPDRPAHLREQSDVSTSREHALIRLRGAFYRVSPSEFETLHDLGRFRIVAVEDLAQFRYHGEKSRLRRELNALASQGLLQTRNLAPGRRTKSLPVAVLTKLGKELLERNRHGRQRIFAGFVKPNEVRHDAAIYRMYQVERQKIERAGGTVRRIVLDYELKQLIYAPLAKLRSRSPQLSPAEYAKHQTQVALENGLRVVDGKIPLPDLRLEYQTAQGELTRVDLELATGHYHGGAMQAKALAGFMFYAADGSGARLSRILEERDITVAILSL